MATIALYASRINQMPDMIGSAKKAVSDFKGELFTLKKKASTVNQSVCNMDGVISSVQASTKIQEEKAESLETFKKNHEEFVQDAVRIDDDVEDLIENRKDDFYDKYNYLKPECEKSKWEKIKDGCKKTVEWCKENWESLVNIVLVAVAVAVFIGLSIMTFGASAVVLAAAIGAFVSMLGQFIGDVIAWRKSGKWTGTWEDYFGAALGGGVAGVALLYTRVVPEKYIKIIACASDAAVSEFYIQNMKNLMGKQDKANSEIWWETLQAAGIAGALGGLYEMATGKLTKTISKTFSDIPALRRLSGRGSYEASYKMVLTKLMNKQIRNFTKKTVINGVVSGLIGDLLKNIGDGIKEGKEALSYAN